MTAVCIFFDEDDNYDNVPYTGSSRLIVRKIARSKSSVGSSSSSEATGVPSRFFIDRVHWYNRMIFGITDAMRYRITQQNKACTLKDIFPIAESLTLKKTRLIVIYDSTDESHASWVEPFVCALMMQFQTSATVFKQLSQIETMELISSASVLILVNQKLDMLVPSVLKWFSRVYYFTDLKQIAKTSFARHFFEGLHVVTPNKKGAVRTVWKEWIGRALDTKQFDIAYKAQTYEDDLVWSFENEEIHFASDKCGVIDEESGIFRVRACSDVLMDVDCIDG